MGYEDKVKIYPILGAVQLRTYGDLYEDIFGKQLTLYGINAGGGLEYMLIIEPDGSTSAPVVCDINDEETIKIVQAIFKQIRKCKDWQPAMKNGKPVRSMVICNFSLSKNVSYR